MIQNESVPIWAMSVGVVVPLVAILGVCVCGCRKTVPKSDLHGLPGMVKITNPEETTNQQMSDEVETAVGNCNTNVDTSDINKRTSTAVNRSLPAIPSDTDRLRMGGVIWESELNGDTGSELYATVGDKHVERESTAASSSGVQIRSVRDQETGQDKSKLLSENQIDDSIHYDSLKSEHPYDKVKKSEHPYAQVRASSNVPASNQIPVSISGQDSREDSRPSSSGVPTQHVNPVPPPRSRRSTSGMMTITGESSSNDSNGSELNGSIGATVGSDRTSDIPAATAIAGRVAASQELPYMTPPIPSQGNFSGDSQDSKGYTSISVREPLASIKAQTKAWSQSQPIETQDSHYATVSDDSDEMYAAIEEPGHVYNSGSETYAQIQPAGVIEHQTIETNAEIYPPQPPSVDSLKHVAQAHSRQASSSSATSSVANLGSPKPEKRQANSPLPPPPSGSPDIGLDKPSTSVVNDINVEEMYAKVVKKKRNTDIDVSIMSVQTDGRHSSQMANELQNTFSSSHDHLQMTQNIDRFLSGGCELITESRSDNMESRTEIEDSNETHERYRLQNDIKYKSGERTDGLGYQDPGYEVVRSKSSDESSGSKTNDSNHASSDGIETFSESNSCNNNRNSFTSTSHSCSKDSNDDNNNDDRADSDCYPKYESVNAIGYASCETQSDLNLFSDDASEPNYESMPSEETEHNYAGVQETSGSSELDPNYEMVEHDDPNYESVTYMETNSYPPYERLHNEMRDCEADVDHSFEQGSRRASEDFVDKTEQQLQSSSNDPGYEEIGQKLSQKSTRPWNDTGPKLESDASSNSVTGPTGRSEANESHFQLLG